MGKGEVKKFSLILALLYAVPAHAVSVEVYFSDKRPSASELTPPGTEEVARATGDLNNDGLQDIATLIKITKDQGQKILIFTAIPSGGFSLWKTGNHHFVDAVPNYMAPFGLGTFEISNGILHIASATAMSMGTWSAGGCEQKWRNEKSGFRLIGLTVADMNRGCACGKALDINYLTGDRILTSNQDASGEQLPTDTITKTKEKPRTILWDNFQYDKLCSIP